MEKKVKYVCPECGEEESWIGSVSWNIEKQDWELDYVFDFGYLPFTCGHCNKEYEDLEEVTAEVVATKIPRCAMCKDTAVSLKATKEWDTTQHKWVEEDPHYWDSYCDNCGVSGQGIEFEEVADADKL